MRLAISGLVAGYLLGFVTVAAQAPVIAPAGLNAIPPESTVQIRFVGQLDTRGIIESVSDDHVVVRRGASRYTYSRTAIERVAVVRVARSFNGPSNAEAVRMIVTDTGIGTRVRVQTTSGARLAGTIVAIDAGGFTVGRGRNRANLDQVSFATVTRLERPRLSRAAKVAIAAAAAVGIWYGLIYPVVLPPGV